MYKKLFIFLVLFSLFTKSVFAGGFNLKSIGQVDTSGQQISHWWYTGSTPLLVGDAAAGAEVTITIDGTDSKATADGTGAWSYNPGSLTDGDHTIVLTSAGSTISFTLTLGATNVDWNAIGGGSAETLPASGTTLPTIVLVSVAGLLFLTAKKLARQN